ncbi:MAG TPA: hypothetical protein VGN72_21235 [Tepidisphaeraceae bacterium]|nr:hypothetical protein [Tepidisphaeraceae bacterium]
MESTTIAIDIRCPFDLANAFLSQPENFPAWASGLGESLEQRDDGWIAYTPDGEMHVRFTPPNPLGVLDHYVTPDGGPPIYIPMRVIANGEGCHVSLTLFRQPDMTTERFVADADWVHEDLKALKMLLESLG